MVFNGNSIQQGGSGPSSQAANLRLIQVVSALLIAALLAVLCLKDPPDGGVDWVSDSESDLVLQEDNWGMQASTCVVASSHVLTPGPMLEQDVTDVAQSHPCDGAWMRLGPLRSLAMLYATPFPRDWLPKPLLRPPASLA